MNVVVGSAFRNSAYNAARYLDRVAALRNQLPSDTVRVIAVEGDSRDTTRDELVKQAQARGLALDLVTHNHGGRVFSSTEHEDRLTAMSGVGNAIFESVRETDDVLFYIESDLLWDAPMAVSLIRLAAERTNNLDVFGPRIMAGKMFYDIWGYRHLDGRRFSPLEEVPPTLIEVSSIGSCLAMRGEVARKCRIRDNYCLVGWCRDARAQGYRIGVHGGLEVNHP